MSRSPTKFERALRHVPQASSLRTDSQDACATTKFANHNVDCVFLETLEFSKMRNRNKFPIDKKRIESLPLGPVRDIGVKTFAGFDQRREYLERTAFGRCFHLFHDRGYALFFDRQIAIRTKLRSGFGKQEPQKMIDFSHGRDGRFTTTARHPLLNRHARWQAFDKIDIRFFKLFDKLSRVRRHAVQKSALSFREENVEGER